MLTTSLSLNTTPLKIQPIIQKIIKEKRISEKEGLVLYNEASLALLGSLANRIRIKKKWEQNIL